MAELNEGQAKAYKAMCEWYKNRTDEQQLFVVAGYSGVGKTFLINYFVKTLGIPLEEIAFCSPSAKAAFRITEANGYPASTIHRLIYKVSTTTEIKKVGGKDVEVTRLVFCKRSPEELRDIYKLIICDEFSMVDATVLEHLMSFGIPLLAVGDSGQLPPVGKPHGYLINPDVQLTEIMRQAADNPIIRVATMLRNGEYVPYGRYGDKVLISRKHMLSDEFIAKAFLGFDQVLCGRNETRRALNTTIRKLKGIDVEENPLPIEGEKVICLQNNYDISIASKYFLSNGMLGYVKNIMPCHTGLANIGFALDFMPDVTTENIITDARVFYDDNYEFDMTHNKCFVDYGGMASRDKSLLLKPPKELTQKQQHDWMVKRISNKNELKEISINRFDFGYAITTHKSQGSEWPNVVVIEERIGSKADHQKWLYTAVTRAKNKVIWIRE